MILNVKLPLHLAYARRLQRLDISRTLSRSHLHLAYARRLQQQSYTKNKVSARTTMCRTNLIESIAYITSDDLQLLSRFKGVKSPHRQHEYNRIFVFTSHSHNFNTCFYEFSVVSSLVPSISSWSLLFFKISAIS